MKRYRRRKSENGNELGNVKVKVKLIWLIVGAIILVVISSGISIIFASPGGNDDPIVSKSYIDKKLKPELETYIDEKVSTTTPESSVFTVVSVKKGEKFYGQSGTEFILRMGNGKIIASASGGIANVTSGYDLTDGASVPPNSLLIIPKDDGRGFEASDEVLIMVKGKYEIK